MFLIVSQRNDNVKKKLLLLYLHNAGIQNYQLQRCVTCNTVFKPSQKWTCLKCYRYFVWNKIKLKIQIYVHDLTLINSNRNHKTVSHYSQFTRLTQNTTLIKIRTWSSSKSSLYLERIGTSRGLLDSHFSLQFIFMFSRTVSFFLCVKMEDW